MDCCTSAAVPAGHDAAGGPPKSVTVKSRPLYVPVFVEKVNGDTSFIFVIPLLQGLGGVALVNRAHAMASASSGTPLASLSHPNISDPRPVESATIFIRERLFTASTRLM